MTREQLIKKYEKQVKNRKIILWMMPFIILLYVGIIFLNIHKSYQLKAIGMEYDHEIISEIMTDYTPGQFMDRQSIDPIEPYPGIMILAEERFQGAILQAIGLLFILTMLGVSFWIHRRNKTILYFLQNPNATEVPK